MRDRVGARSALAALSLSLGLSGSLSLSGCGVLSLGLWCACELTMTWQVEQAREASHAPSSARSGWSFLHRWKTYNRLSPTLPRTSCFTPVYGTWQWHAKAA